jgi:hypothetical protein
MNGNATKSGESLRLFRVLRILFFLRYFQRNIVIQTQIDIFEAALHWLNRSKNRREATQSASQTGVGNAYLEMQIAILNLHVIRISEIDIFNRLSSLLRNICHPLRPLSHIRVLHLQTWLSVKNKLRLRDRGEIFDRNHSA